MQIWSAEIKELESFYTSVEGQFPELEKELEHLIETKDANVVLLYSRRCLEIIVTELCEIELKRPRKTEPLKGIIDKLNKEEKVPSYIITSMDHLNSLSTFGAHPKEFDPEQVRPILLNLATIIKWYVKYKDTQIISQVKPEGAKYESKEPVNTRESIRKPKKKLILLLSGLLVVMAIVVALFVFDIISGVNQTKELEKSIAVLPFLDDSQDKENTSFINGIMDEVLINLQTIKDLRVISRNSVEQYRGADKPSTPDIAEALGVNYIVEGSGQKYGNTFRIRVQLIEAAKDKHLWGESYEQKIEKVEDIFSIQNKIAVSIASELKAIITIEEKQLIEKTSTTSLTAYDFYQRGREEYEKYLSDNNNTEALEIAKDLYLKALEYDSTFAQAYTGLAWVYWDKHFWEDILSEDFLDSVTLLCDIALSYDDQLSEAHTIKGQYFIQISKPEQALKEFDEAVKFNPNDWMAYKGRGEYYNYDLLKSIEDYQKAISLNHGSQLPGLLRSIGDRYLNAGFMEKAKKYYQEAFELDEDSISNYWYLGFYENILGNYAKAIEFHKKLYAIDSSDIYIIWWLGMNYLFFGQNEEALKYFKKWLERTESWSDITFFGLHRIGLAYWQIGYKEEAKYYFSELIKYCDRLKKMERYDPYRPAYDLAATYAFMGDKEKAYENLRLWAKMPSCQLWWIINFKNDPLFNGIRNEPEFQQIVRYQEAKYQAEHERVRKWLEEKGE